MANASLVSPKNPHFFKPLLSGFQSQLKIPVKFFSKYIEGKHEGKTVNLISDASERIWKVKREGQTLTDGWKEFVEAHKLRIGDFVIFRHEGDLLFHVTAFGPSCCEIQYPPSHSQNIDEEESDEIGESSREEEENIVENVISVYSSNLNIFSQTVTVSNLSTDTLTVPMYFARRNCLDEGGGREIVLMNEEGRTWASELRSFSRVRIVRGWTSFCTENKLEVGDSCTFKLLQNMEKPVFQLCGRTKPERKKETLSVEDNISGENRFVKLKLTPYSLRLGKQYLPVSFTRVNMLNKPGKIILVDRNGKEWSMKLQIDSGKGYIYMYIMGSNGWKSFCSANGVGVGESLTLELIRGGETPLLKFCPQMEGSPFKAEVQAHKKAQVQILSEETRPEFTIRENKDEGETSHRSRASNKSSADQATLKRTEPCSVSDHVAKVINL